MGMMEYEIGKRWKEIQKLYIYMGVCERRWEREKVRSVKIGIFSPELKLSNHLYLMMSDEANDHRH